MSLNDAHCHFFSTRFLELLTAAAGPKRPGLQDTGLQDVRRPDLSGPADSRDVVTRLQWDPPGSAEDLADRWVQELDRHSVARAAIIASIPGDESSVAAAVARHPSRFVGFFMVNPNAPEAEARLATAFGESGLRCACLFPAMHKYALDDDGVVKVFEAAARHDGAVFVHCGVLTVGVRTKLGLPSRFDWRLGDPLAVSTVASAYPSVPVIIPHFGAGFFREALMAATQSSNIHLDTSSSNSWMKYYPGLTLDAVFRQALEVVGPERLLFGTDSSFFPRGWQRGIYDGQQKALADAGASAAHRELVFGGNFDRIFKS